MSTDTLDYYQLLGIAPTATTTEIKKAYRRLARRYHPDVNTAPDAEQRFKDLNCAYEILIDPARRRDYNHANGPFTDTTAGTGIDTPTMNGLDVASQMLRVLEATWQAIRARHPEVPPVVVILASGTGGKQTKWGHHAPARWNVTGEDRAEIMISGEGLTRGPIPVLGTLLHEAVHALAAARGIQDTSRQGRYHNKRFATLARELGIDVEHDDRIGWSITTVPDTTAAHYRRNIDALGKTMTLWRRSEDIAPRQPRRNSNLIAAICMCERTIRIAASTLTEAGVMCMACGAEFEPKL